MKSVGLLHGSMGKKKKSQEVISVSHLDHPSALDKIPWVPVAPMAHRSNLSWCLAGLTVREDML